MGICILHKGDCSESDRFGRDVTNGPSEWYYRAVRWATPPTSVEYDHPVELNALQAFAVSSMESEFYLKKNYYSWRDALDHLRSRAELVFKVGTFTVVLPLVRNLKRQMEVIQSISTIKSPLVAFLQIGTLRMPDSVI